MIFARKIALALVLASAISLPARAHALAPIVARSDSLFVLAQATVPPTGMMDTEHPMPMNERMLMRFPQPVRVGDLIGLPVLDDNSRTLGYVRQVVRTPQGKIKLIVAYGGFVGFDTRLVAVPIEVVGILGRQLASLDMSPKDYASAPTWRDRGDTTVPHDESVRIALARR